MVLGVIAALVQYGDWQHVLLVLGVFGIGQVIESYLLTPWLVGDRIGLHPVAVIFAIMAGGQLFGFLGVLLALPVAAVANVLLRYAHERYTHSRLYARRHAGDRARPVVERRRAGDDRAVMPLTRHAAATPIARAAMPPRPRNCRWRCAIRRTSASTPSSPRPRARSRNCVRSREGAGARLGVLAGPAGRRQDPSRCSRPARRREAAGRSAAFLPLEAAAGRLRDALEAFDGHALVALDGLEAIAGDRDDEVALFDFHNRARSAGTRVLYTAHGVRRMRWRWRLPDLRSRLAQCTRVALSPLDDDGAARSAARTRAAARPRARRCGARLAVPAASAATSRRLTGVARSCSTARRWRRSGGSPCRSCATHAGRRPIATTTRPAVQ